MKNIKSGWLGVALTLLTFLVAGVMTVSAATSGNGMRVAPVRTDLTIQQGTSKTFSVFVENVTEGTEKLKVIPTDFVASTDESGAPALLLNGESNDKHGLKKYISAIEEVTVEPGKQKEIKITVTIPKGVAGGGYYGAIRFAPSGNGTENNVSLAGSVGSLILVKVPGDVVEKLSLVSFDVRKDNEQKVLFTSNKGLNATVRFRNEGNVQEEPFGKVTLKKGSKVLGQYEVNGGAIPGNVLPDSVRKFNVPLKDVSSFGKYTIEGNFGYGSAGQLLTAKTSFYVVPLWLIGAIIVLVVALVAAFVVLKRKMSRRSSHSRR